MVKDTNTNDLWLNLKHSYSESDGKYKIAVNGYESKNYTYFDVDFTNNKKFDDEDYNIELYNGKYKIKKKKEFGMILIHYMIYYRIMVYILMMI